MRERDRELKSRIVPLDPLSVHRLLPEGADPHSPGRIAASAEPRIRRGVEKPHYWAVQVLEIGALSYLYEALCSWPSGAVDLAIAFIETNHEVIAELEGDFALDPIALERFSTIVVENRYDWPTFAAAFVDPDEAAKARLRENRAMSSDERYRQHQQFAQQVARIRNASTT